MNFNTPPYLRQNNRIRRIMGQVLLALLPGIAVYAWLIGPAILAQLGIATLTALLAEAAMLRLQKKEITPETARAVTEISTFMGMLSDYYLKDRTEGLKFDDDM